MHKSGREKGHLTEGKKTFLRNTALVFLAVLWSVASYIQWAVEDRTVAFQIPLENGATIEMRQGDVFSQELQINRFIKGLKILTANGGGDRAQTNYGTLRFTLRQGGTSEVYDVDINGIADWTYVNFSGALKRFHDGTATLEIESLDTQYGSSLFIPYTGQDIYEIPAASFNGEPLPGPLCVQYDTGNPRPVAPTVWAIGAALLLTIIAAGVILTKWPKNVLVYIVTVALVFLTICLKYPSFTINGEAWSEVGALYLPSAQNNGFFQNLFVLEVGLYLNFIGRIIPWLAVHCLPTLTSEVMAMDLMGLLLLSMMGASLATGAFKKYITPLESVLASVLIVSSLVTGEALTVLSTGYWGIVPMVILLAVIIFRVDISNRLYWFLGSMAILSTLSKMAFVIFMPIILVVYLLQRKQLARRDVAFGVLEIAACLFQGVGSLILRNRMGLNLMNSKEFGSIVLSNPLRMLNHVFYGAIQVINTLLRVRTGGFLMWNLLLLAAVVGGGVFLLVCIGKKKYRQQAVFALAMLLTLLGNHAILQITNFEAADAEWGVVKSVSMNWHMLTPSVALIGIVFLLFVCLRQTDLYRRERAIRAAGTVTMALGMLVMCSIPMQETFGDFYDQDGARIDWKNYTTMASHETFMIPVGPVYDWRYQSPDCQAQIGSVETSKLVELDLDTQYAVSFYVHKSASTNQISLHTYYASVYDRDGDLAATVPQISDPEKAYVGFDLDMPVNGISRVEFTLEDGRPAYVDGEYLVGYRGAEA